MVVGMKLSSNREKGRQAKSIHEKTGQTHHSSHLQQEEDLTEKGRGGGSLNGEGRLCKQF